MTGFISRSALLAGAVLVSPLQAQTPQPPADEPPATAAPTDVSEGYEDEEDGEAIVVTGQRPRGSVIGDIPPENTLNARDVRATGATDINEHL